MAVRNAAQVPDGGYGWVVVLAAFGNFNLLGTHFAGFALLYHPLVQQYGCTYATAGLVGSMSSACVQLPAFLFAALVEGRGCRVTCMAGALLAATGFLLSACAPNIFMLYVTYGVLTGCGMGMMYNANVVIVQQYFDRKRGLASALSMAGLSSGAICGAWLLYYSLTQYGLNGTMLILAGYNLHGVVFGALHRPLHSLNTDTIRLEDPTSGHLHQEIPLGPHEATTNRPRSETYSEVSTYVTKAIETNDSANCEDSLNSAAMTVQYDEYHCKNDEHCKLKKSQNGHSTKDEELKAQSESFFNPVSSGYPQESDDPKTSICDFTLLKNPVFFIYGFATLLMNFGMVGYRAHNPNRALHYGISPRQAAMLPQVTGLGTFLSQLVFGFLADCPCVNRKLLYSVGMLVGGAIEMTVIFCTSFYPILLHSALFGICCGAFLSVQSTVLVDLLSVERIAKSQALLGFFIGTASLIVTPFAGFIYDVTDNYNIPYLVTGSLQLIGGSMLTAMFIMLLLKRQKQTTS